MEGRGTFSDAFMAVMNSLAKSRLRGTTIDWDAPSAGSRVKFAPPAAAPPPPPEALLFEEEDAAVASAVAVFVAETAAGGSPPLESVDAEVLDI